MNPEINTARLVLAPLAVHQLEMYLSGEADLTREVGEISREILTPMLKKAIEMKIVKMEGVPAIGVPWITYWLIKTKGSDFGLGLIGFKGMPDESGEVEIGYGIDQKFWNKGYATEALQGMVRWAFEHAECRRITAPDTLRSNPASNRVLEKAGFRIFTESPEAISWCLEKGEYQQEIE
jgi:RimJ/RimL family protein N-acetyltransferase